MALHAHKPLDGVHIIACHGDSAIFRLITHTLRKAGACVFHAHDAPAAYVLAQAIPATRFLISGSCCQQVDGKRLSDRILEEFPGIAVLQVAGFPQPGPDELPLNVPVLSPPFTPAQLLTTVRWLLAEGQTFEN